MDINEAALLGVAIACVLEEESENKNKVKERRKKRSAWVKPWLLKRDQLGFYDNLLQEFRLEDAVVQKLPPNECGQL